MKIPCFRCGKKIKDADSSNSDYVIASDTIATEVRKFIIVLIHSQATLEKEAKMLESDLLGLPIYPDLQIDDSEYDTFEVATVREAIERFDDNFIKIITGTREEQIQKTGLICHKCYKPTDTVIWGIHKLPP